MRAAACHDVEVLPGETDFSGAEEQLTLIVGAIVFVLIAVALLTAVIWKSAWKEGRRHRTPEGIDHGASARHLLILGLGTIVVLGPMLLFAVIVAGGILVGLATIAGASLVVGTMVAAALLLLGAGLLIRHDLEQFLSDNADYISPRQVRASDREMERRLQQARER